MKTELERYKEALAIAQTAIRAYKNRGGTLWMSCADALDKIEAILNPPPEMEEVEVTAWKHATFGDLTEEAETAAKWGAEAIELTGTYKRPKPQPVERSVEFPVEWERCEGIVFPCAALGSDADIHALEGKTGTLTFTWHEQP